MKEIILKLYENGFDFEYENFGGNGESVECMYLGLKVELQEGELRLDYYDQSMKYDETPENYKMLGLRIDEIIVEETTGNS